MVTSSHQTFIRRKGNWGTVLKTILKYLLGPLYDIQEERGLENHSRPDVSESPHEKKDIPAGNLKKP